MCLAQGPQRSGADETRTLGLESSNLPLSHWAPSFQATGSIKFSIFQNVCMIYKHAYLNTLLLLHFTCMLSLVGWLVVFVALRPKSTAMVIAGRSVHLTTLFPGQA